MHMKSIKLHHFGPFEDLEIKFPKKKPDNKARVIIFTGPNGSGKTSLLHAIGYSQGQQTQVQERFWGQGYVYGEFNTGGKLLYSLEEDFENIFEEHFSDLKPADLYSRMGVSIAHVDGKRISSRDFDIDKHSYYAAYAGHRELRQKPIQAMKEVELGMVWEDASFDHSRDVVLILQWIANLRTKEALERVKGNNESADRYGHSIARLEQTIQKLTGLELRFVVETEPLHIAVTLHGRTLKIETLPDGLKSIICWIADLLMRLELRGFKGDIFQKDITLLLDEVDIHLHPKWQRRILPAIQELFPNATIFVSTHSPFVVGSVSDAWVYNFAINDQGYAYLDKMVESKAGSSVSLVLAEIFDVDEAYDIETEEQLDVFYRHKQDILEGKVTEPEALLQQARIISRKSLELRDLIGRELRQLSRLSGQEFSL